MYIMNPDEILDTSEYPEGNRKVVIFDDLLAAPKNVQEKILTHFIDGRHHLISPIYLSQSYYRTPATIRLNCSHLIVYAPVQKRHRKIIADDNSFDADLFSRLKPFDFLFIDNVKKTYRKNFIEEIQEVSPSSSP